MSVHRIAAKSVALLAGICLASPMMSAQSLEQRLKDRIEETLTCADEATVSMSPSSLTQNSGLFVPIIPPPPNVVLRLVRELEPRAGNTQTNTAELSRHASLVSLAYDMYQAQQDGDDEAAVFDLPGFELKGLIYNQLDPNADRQDEGAFQGFIASDDLAPDDRVIVLRGTMRFDEWSQNIRISQVEPSFDTGSMRARVHSGFLEIYEGLEIETLDGIRMDYQDALRAAGERSNAITFIGHSLGGALASLSAFETNAVAGGDDTALNLVTFGSPRVGNYAFAQFASELNSSVRVCNMVDAITTIPASQSEADYVHLGNVVKLSAFDHSAVINNWVSDHNEQVACWHDIDAYISMLSGQAMSLDSECHP